MERTEVDYRSLGAAEQSAPVEAARERGAAVLQYPVTAATADAAETGRERFGALRGRLEDADVAVAVVERGSVH